jgi:hypothetical protein
MLSFLIYLFALIGIKSFIFGNRWPWQEACPTCGNLAKKEKKEKL